MSFHIDILPIRYTVESSYAKAGELSWVERGYRIQECVDLGWLAERGEEGWIWVRETISAPEVDPEEGCEFTAESWPDNRYGQQGFKPGELTLIDGKLCYPIGKGLGLR